MSEAPQYVITVYTGVLCFNQRTLRYETRHGGVMSLEDWQAAPRIKGITPGGMAYEVADPTYRRGEAA